MCIVKCKLEVMIEILQLHSMGNFELAAHLKESPYNSTYLSPDIETELIILIVEEILSSISSEVLTKPPIY